MLPHYRVAASPAAIDFGGELSILVGQSRFKPGSIFCAPSLYFCWIFRDFIVGLPDGCVLEEKLFQSLLFLDAL